MDHRLDVGDQEISWFEGVLSPFIFNCFILDFRRLLSFRECPCCSWAHCFARGSVLEYREAVRACAMRPIFGF
jgi:hypothetical protein